MKPTVRKPAAQVVLVGRPLHWTGADVQSAAMQAGVEVNEVSVSSAALAGALSNAAKNTKLGMVVVVQGGPVLASELAFARAHSTLQFAFFGNAGAASGAGQVQNTLQVIPDEGLAGYVLGSLAGNLAASAQAVSVGWLSGGQPTPSQAVVEQAMAGAAAADPGVNMTRVALSGLTASPPSSGSLPPAIGQNSTGGLTPGGQGPPPLPSVLVATQPLTVAQWKILQGAGVRLVSLCAQSAGVSPAGSPTVPGAGALQAVLKDFANGSLPHGAMISRAAPLIAMNSSQVTATVQSLVNDVEVTLQDQPSVATTAWNALPGATRQAFAPIAKAASSGS